MINIKNFDSAINALKNLDLPIIGIGQTAFNRVGLEKILGNLQIIYSSKKKDDEVIKKFIDIFFVKGIDNIKGKKNILSVLKQEKVIDYINSFGRPFLLFGNPDREISDICSKHKWRIIGNTKKTTKKIGDKIFFRELLKKLGIPSITGETTKLSKLDYEKLKKKYNKFVIQLSNKTGGRGVFFIKTPEDFKNLKKLKEQEVIVTKFIEGPSPSITGCVTKYGILYTNLQHQLLDIPECRDLTEGSGLFCGHDWTSSNFKREVEKKAYDYTEKIGGYLKKMGYKGIFGLDMVLDKKENELYVVECNPRFLGSFPTLIMVQLRNEEVPLILFHILEFLNIPYKMDFEEINKNVKRPKKGAHIILYNKIGSYGTNKNSLKAGVYIFKSGKLVFRRQGYSLEELKEGEILIVNVPFKNSIFRPNWRVCRILTLDSISDKDLKLNKKMISVIREVYSKLKIKPYKLVTNK